MGTQTGYSSENVASDGRYYQVEARAFAAERGFQKVAVKRDSLAFAFARWIIEAF